MASAVFVDVTDCEIEFLAGAPHLFFKLGLKGEIVFHGLTFELSGGAAVRLERFVSVTSVHAVSDVESSAHLHNHQVSADYFEGAHEPKAAG